MANRIETGKKPVALTLNVVMLAYLDDLILTGMYGSAHTQAVEALMRERIKQLIESGELEKRKGDLID